jgi:hypothetical protein
MHPAKLLLREDIKCKVHLTTHQTPRQLQKLRPDEYLLFKPKKFVERICQEILQICFHYLELKRKAIQNGKKMENEN